MRDLEIDLRSSARAPVPTESLIVIAITPCTSNWPVAQRPAESY
jgi:hypothetical protein